ncbi:hypothetical protein M404DRAFT_807314 [Pisolithus tinctorius Marx 270]|uniref:Uncharacterized protein n=1 Tax=Pisolithus tinctorius Marx 270 TaxID=870435 RepID=A0A0C3NW33_PISTI|nr:hypothetical protein M404DRAFT_807314 [Pisolithus tinctorius Marx 270]
MPFRQLCYRTEHQVCGRVGFLHSLLTKEHWEIPWDFLLILISRHARRSCVQSPKQTPIAVQARDLGNIEVERVAGCVRRTLVYTLTSSHWRVLDADLSRRQFR